MCTPRVVVLPCPESAAGGAGGPAGGGVRRCRSPPPVASRGGWLVLARLLGLVGLLLGLVHRAVGVLRWAVDGVEDQRVLAGVDEVVLRARGDDDEVALGDLPGVARDAGLAGAADEREDLVDVLVDLFADLTARRDGHDHQLGLLAGPEHAAEVRALLGLGGDRVVDDGRHGRALLSLGDGHDRPAPRASRLLVTSPARASPRFGRLSGARAG